MVPTFVANIVDANFMQPLRNGSVNWHFRKPVMCFAALPERMRPANPEKHT
jgi:hypothetical protein